MKAFKLTKDKETWPNWLLRAWEREWDAPGSFQPVKDRIGTYYAITMQNQRLHFRLGDLIPQELFHKEKS